MATFLERGSVKYSLLALFVVCFGFGAYFYGHFSGSNPHQDDLPISRDVFEWRSQLMGWASAVLYLGSRIPQIAKNLRTRCEGLSLALFLFAIMGNTFFVLSICVTSLQWRYLLVNASWLAGSGLCVFTDIFILSQFFRFQAEDLLAATARLENGLDA